MIPRAALLGLLLLAPLLDTAGARSAAFEPGTAAAFHLGRHDTRRCAPPACGGTWVRLVNLPATPCGGGLGRRRECYVAAVDTSRVQAPAALRPRLARLVSSGRALAKGRLVRGRVPGRPRLATLVATEVWPASSDPRAPSGSFSLLRDNGVRCVTTPCFSTDASLLNRSRVTTISTLDLTRVRATPGERERAWDTIDGGGLIVAGQVAVDEDAGPAGQGRVLVASRLYASASR